MSYVAPTFLSFEDIISRAANVIRDRAFREIPKNVLRSLAGDACSEFARQSEVVRGTWRGALVTGQRLHPLPHDCIRPLRVATRYQGISDLEELDVFKEGQVFDGFSRIQTGRPGGWYISKDRKAIGLWPLSNTGGLDVRVTGGTTTTIVFPASASATDDVYNLLDVRVMDGVNEDYEGQITDYDGATLTATVSPAMGSAIVSGTRVVVHPDSLEIEYVQKGNRYTVLPIDGVVDAATATIAYNQIGTDSTTFDFVRDYFQDFELMFTSGALNGIKTKIATSRSSGTSAIFTLDPELPGLPLDNATFRVTQCPNVPSEYAAYLVEFIIFQAVRNLNPKLANEAHARFLQGVREAGKLDEPGQGAQYMAVRDVYNDRGRRRWSR